MNLLSKLQNIMDDSLPWTIRDFFGFVIILMMAEFGLKIFKNRFVELTISIEFYEL